MASEPKRILVVEDHPLVAEILSQVAKATFDSPIIHTAGSMRRALEIVKTEGDPDFVILDLLLPDATKMEALRQLAAVCEHAPIVVVSALEEPATIQAVLEAGAAAYVPKTTPTPALNQILRLVAAGGRYVPPQALGKNDRAAARSPGSPLTRRQVEVLYLVSQGLSNKEIARTMGITVETVKQHLQAIYTALHASSRMRAVVIARRLGITLENISSH